MARGGAGGKQHQAGTQPQAPAGAQHEQVGQAARGGAAGKQHRSMTYMGMCAAAHSAEGCNPH
jgi:hypothetical protein